MLTRIGLGTGLPNIITGNKTFKGNVTVEGIFTAQSTTVVLGSVTCDKLNLTNIENTYNDLTTLNDIFTFQCNSPIGTNPVQFWFAAPAGKGGSLYINADGQGGTWNPYIYLTSMVTELGLGASGPLSIYASDIVGNSEDVVDYLQIKTVNSVPQITTVGACNLNINAGGVNILINSEDSGRVGIGTTTPARKLDVSGDSQFANQINISGSIARIRSSGDISFSTQSVVSGLYIRQSGDAAGNAVRVGVHNTTPQAGIHIGGARVSHYTVGSGDLMVSGKAEVDGEAYFDGNVYTGQIEFEENSGYVTAMDMPVSGQASNGTVEGYTFNIDGATVVSCWSISSGDGTVTNKRVGIVNSNPNVVLDISGDVSIGSHSGIAKEILTLAQNDMDMPFIGFRGTASGDANNSISTWRSASIAGYIKTYVNGVSYWIPYYTAPSG